MYSALEIAKWCLLKNNAEVVEHEAVNDNYEVYEGITHLKLQKLLYYAQGISLALYDEKLFYENIEAWPHGPVVRDVYNNYEKNGRKPIEIEMKEEEELLLKDITNDNKINNILILTYDNFAIYTAWQLRQMTHENGSPWDITEKTKGLFKTIDTNLIQKYFKENVVSV